MGSLWLLACLLACLNASRDSWQLVTTLTEKDTFLFRISSPFPNRLWGLFSLRAPGALSLVVIRLSCNANQSSRSRTEVKNAGISDPLMKIAVMDQNSNRHVIILSALGQSMLNISKSSLRLADIYCSVILRNIVQNLLFLNHFIFRKTCLWEDITLPILDVETLKFRTFEKRNKSSDADFIKYVKLVYFYVEFN